MIKRRKSRELLLALLAVIFISMAYLVVQVIFQDAPAAGSFYGHSLGILGFVLMLMTETLYTLRKRSRSSRLGPTARWLEFHIFTGIVGPYLVLLHTSWKFNGLAGLLMLFTVVIVASGFIGRYIYTAIPRTASGAEMSQAQLQQEIASVNAQLDHVRSSQDTLPSFTLSHPAGKNWIQQIFGRAWYDFQEQIRLSRLRRQVGTGSQDAFQKLVELTRENRRLQRQMESLAAARRLLALWHAVHIPIGLTLFAMAFIHVGAAIYFAVLH